ncbi:MAG: carbamoyl phosphate synthase small subunit [Bacteroidales bacterium]|nr:carbamoyl phosphate synthase small subunit [Bacteroidales bacterium]
MKQMKLVLENGQSFCGTGCGSYAETVGEIVFNTSMVGYQEIASDPSYAGKIVVMTYPLMGQYGITAEDYEARTSGPAGLVVRECCGTPSNFRFTKTLSEELEEHGVPCVGDVDTRMLTRIIRNAGGDRIMRAVIVGEETSVEEALALIRNTRPESNPVSAVSCTKRWFSRTPNHRFDVVALDCGIKHSIVAELNRRGCNVTVVPYNTTAEEIMAFNPDGLLICGGPGSPESAAGIIPVINALKGRLPIAGISLGHQLIAMSYGAATKLCLHHGGRPVRRVSDGKIISAEHSHCYVVDPESIRGTALEVSWLDVSDSSIEGLECPADRVSGVQFCPEGAPGPKESDFFDKFTKSMEEA